MNRYFNITGPNRERQNFGLDLLKRVDYDSIRNMIEKGRYFTVCSPKQSGKTTLLLTLQQKINAEGKYRCLYCNVEPAQVTENDVTSGIRLILARLAAQAEVLFRDLWPYQNFVSILGHVGADSALIAFFERWRLQEQTPQKPMILMLDGIDLLSGKTLASVLRQLRTGQVGGADLFLQSVIFSGVRDIRDVDIEIGENKFLIGRSGSDIRENAIVIRSFTQNEIRELCEQYTAETGQTFHENAHPRLYSLTGGRPWLVNALLCEALYEMEFEKDPTKQITPGMIDAAKDHFVARQEAYLDQLALKLSEPGVRTTLFPILTGGGWKHKPPQEHLDYLEDLELIRRSPMTGWGITNAMYREIIPKVLGRSLRDELINVVDRSSFLKPDGRLNFREIIESYRKIYCAHFLTWRRRYDLEGVLAQMLLFAFLHYILGDRGRMECDYALGTGRVDIGVGWGYSAESGQRQEERFVVEIRLYDSRMSHEAFVRLGVEQTVAYALPRQPDETYLIVLDEDESKTWYDRLFEETHTRGETQVNVYGL